MILIPLAAIAAIGGIATGISGMMQNRANQKAAEDNKRNQRKAEAAAMEKVLSQRRSPGASFSPFGFDTMLRVFGNSMAGRTGGFNLQDALIAMGARAGNGSYGPLFGGYDYYTNWRRGNLGQGYAPAQEWFKIKEAEKEKSRKDKLDDMADIGTFRQ